MALPAAVEELLVKVVTNGFTLYCCGPKDAPRALVACYEWPQCVDLLTVRDFEPKGSSPPGCPQQNFRWISSRLTSWSGLMRDHHSTRCKHCWS